MLMGERVQRRESCDARRSEVGAYLYKTVMCVKSSCVGRMSGRARVRSAGQRTQQSESSGDWSPDSGHSGADRTDQTRTVRCQDVWFGLARGGK